MGWTATFTNALGSTRGHHAELATLWLHLSVLAQDDFQGLEFPVLRAEHLAGNQGPYCFGDHLLFCDVPDAYQAVTIKP